MSDQPPAPRPPRPPLTWGEPDTLLGFTIRSAKPEKGVHYLLYEAKAGEWRASVTTGTRYKFSRMVTTGGHLLESARMICENHWQNLEL